MEDAGKDGERDKPRPSVELAGTDRQAFEQKALAYFKNVLSTTLKLPLKKIHDREPFESYGIDSIMVMKLTNHLEAHFGSLSKTIFFEYRSIREVTEFFIKSHGARLHELLGWMGWFPLKGGRRKGVHRPGGEWMGKPRKGRPRTGACRIMGVRTEKWGPGGREIGPPGGGERRHCRAPGQGTVWGHGPRGPGCLRIRTLDIAIIGLSGRYPQAETLKRSGRICSRAGLHHLDSQGPVGLAGVLYGRSHKAGRTL